MKLNRDFLILGRGNPSRRESSSSKREHSADHMKHLEDKVINYLHFYFIFSIKIVKTIIFGDILIKN